MDRPTKVIASTFSLAAFAVAVVAGLLAGNSGTTVLWNAIVATLVCNAIGIVVAMTAFFVMDQHLAAYRVRHPISDGSSAAVVPNPASQPAQSTIHSQSDEKEKKK